MLYSCRGRSGDDMAMHSQDKPFPLSFSHLFNDPVGGLAMRVVLGLLFGLGLTIFWSYWKLPPEIPLSYSRPWGAAQLVPSAFLFFLAGGLVILTIVNSILAAKLSATDLILGRILAWVSALVVFLVDITLLRVVLLVT